MSKWEKIPVGGRFYYDGNPVRKTGFDTFEDSSGIECQFQPLFESKLQLFEEMQGAKKKAVIAEEVEPEWLVDPQSRVMRKNPNAGKPIKTTKKLVKKSNKKERK